MKKTRITLFLVAAILLCAVQLFAGGTKETKAAQEEAGPAPGKYNEAPMLKALVEAGKLPPVEERLPKNPLVLPVLEKTGKYGGSINTMYAGRITPLGGYNVANSSGQTMVTYAWGLRGKPGEIVPNLASEFSNNDEMTKFTIQLREGLKWSDGHAFTTEDIAFYWNDVLKNKTLTKRVPSLFANADGSAMTLNIINEITFELLSDAPKPFFWFALAKNFNLTQHPKHYMTQFHSDFAPKADLAARLKEAGLEKWNELYSRHIDDYRAKHLTQKPRMQAWVPVKLAPELPPWVWARNPYFWAVDEEGNQLPYIDELLHTKAANIEVVSMATLAGDLDYVWAAPFKLLPELKQAETDGKIKVLYWDLGRDANSQFYFNMNHKDKGLRKIFNDKRFRIAVSHAMDREELNKLLFFGLLSPQQPMLIPASPLYEKTKHLGKRYTEYDPGKANQLLDEMGLNKRGKDGMRLRSDGSPLFINFSVYDENASYELEIVVEHLKKVGLNVDFSLLDRRLFNERYGALDWDAMTILGEPLDPHLFYGGRAFVQAAHFVPFPAVKKWYETNGESGEAPTGKVKENLEKWEQMKTEPNPAIRDRLLLDIVENASEELWIIGTLNSPPLICGASPKLRNISTDMNIGWAPVFGDVGRPETYFFED